MGAVLDIKKVASFPGSNDPTISSISNISAEILEIDEMVGSLEPGKDATFFISNTAPMLQETNPIKAYIKGREVDLSDRQKDLWVKYKEKYKRMGQLND